MAKITIGKGCENYITQLRNLEMATDYILGRAVYEGAKAVADAVSSEIDKLPIDNKSGKDRRRQGVTTAQKAGLKSGLGIAKLRNDNGFVNVKIGFDGYNKTRTKKYPHGQPNAMIARSVDSGSSFMVKNPFISRASNSAKALAEVSMSRELDKQIKNKIGG